MTAGEPSSLPAVKVCSYKILSKIHQPQPKLSEFMWLVTFFRTYSFWTQLLRDSALLLRPQKAGTCSGRKAFFHLSAPSQPRRQSLMFCMKVFPISSSLSGRKLRWNSHILLSQDHGTVGVGRDLWRSPGPAAFVLSSVWVSAWMSFLTARCPITQLLLINIISCICIGYSHMEAIGDNLL